ncbi:heme o synthase [Buchnera aphidicola (Mollitrichosiphum nigrofasciatum)]|uniref:heme o synthase n=1 Tax=Buchnera aphidicola TaxID=9 RepID=UPI0031B80BE1
MSKIKKIFCYLELIKPRLIIGNIITMIGGFFLAFKSEYYINFYVLLYSVVGLFFVIASSCLLNNVIDYKIDAKMYRTKNRILVQNNFLRKQAIVYAIAFFFLGEFFFINYVNILTAFLSFLGLFIYVVLYSLCKRYSIYSTIIGSFSGSMPIIIGYCAVKNKFDLCVVLLFLILTCWQISHFYAISILYENDYNNIKFPIFLIEKGFLKTQLNICLHIFLFFISIIMLYLNGFLNTTCNFIMNVLIFIWFVISYIICKKKSSIFLKKMNVYYSIIIIVSFSFLITVNY